MVKIFIGGVHGIGKTSLVERIDTGLPLVKYTNVDMLVGDCDRGFIQQLKRMQIMADVISHMPETVPCIVDRSVYDFKIYNTISTAYGMEYDTLQRNYEALEELFNKQQNVINIMLIDTGKNVLERIHSRNRPYEDDNFNNKALRAFYEFTPPQTIKLMVNEAESYIMNILGSYQKL
jgi:hypothetical protein